MTETLLSPGILTRENDQSPIVQGPQIAGAAIVGPTVKGPVNIPTLVTSYSDYLNKFGGTFESGSTINEYLTSISAYNYFQQGGTGLLVTRVVSGSFLPATSTNILNSQATASASFLLETLSAGAIMNSSGSETTNGALVSGSADNLRWEITSPNTSSGTFNLLIRKGNDLTNSKSILESWTNLSLDPNSTNYIEAVIGNQSKVLTDNYIQIEGDYSIKSKYIRVKQVNTPTLNYFDNNGVAKSQYTASIPVAASGTFGGATGNLSSIYGTPDSAYTSSFAILANKDEFQFDILTAPGATQPTNSSVVATLIQTCIDRGDSIAIVDVTDKGDNILTAVAEASEIDSSYAATYYPWVQVNSPQTGKLVWVPPSTIVPAVYEYNDRAGAPWFAPAGFKRGGISVVQTERKLSPTDRDTLQAGKVNPIATFPGQGIVIYGQKTLQTKASALDRVNVRRLLIELKRYIGQVGNTFVFEQNTIATRNSFQAKIRPYLDSIQQRDGLYAYKIVMDDTNNTSDVIDRNQLIGQIFIQPTKTVEFVILDFNINPTGTNI
jgi:phage tail sheath protein FI